MGKQTDEAAAEMEMEEARAARGAGWMEVGRVSGQQICSLFGPGERQRLHLPGTSD